MERMQEKEEELENMLQIKKQKENHFEEEITELEARDLMEQDRYKQSLMERNALLGQNIDAVDSSE